jgi:hypothetical protein
LANEPTPNTRAGGEKQIEVDGEKKWLYVAIDTESKLLLKIDVFSPPRDRARGVNESFALMSQSEREAF